MNVSLPNSDSAAGAHPAAVREALLAAAAYGAPEAQEALGRHLLTVEPYDYSQALDLIVAAAKAGVGRAEHLIACVAASGMLGTPNWPAAIDHLASAAEMGDSASQAELTLLAGAAPARPETVSGEHWSRLATTVDLQYWLTPARPRIALSSPRIGIVDGFATPQICQWLIAKTQPLLERAHTVDPQTGQALDVPERTNRQAEFDLGSTDLVLLAMRARIAALTGLRVQDMEATAILSYAPGEQFLPHYDFLDTSLPGHVLELEARGQRVLTFLMYLNEAYEAGETEFPKANFRFRGHTGDALLFWNINSDFTPDPMTFHAGLPPTSGEKFLLSQWVRGRPPGSL